MDKVQLHTIELNQKSDCESEGNIACMLISTHTMTARCELTHSFNLLGSVAAGVSHLNLLAEDLVGLAILSAACR